MADLRPHVRRIASAADALAYSTLLRRFEVDDDEIVGLPAATIETAGASPRFEEEMTTLGVDPSPRAVPTDDGYLIDRPVVALRPTRVLLVREHVRADGRYSCDVVRTLAEGHDADRFVRFPR